MKLKHLPLTTLASLSLALTLASGTPAQMNHDDIAPTSTGQFQRIDQPLWSRVAVTGAGLSLIGLELWWFLRSKPKSRKATTTGGVQAVTVVVDGGYDPSHIVVQAGQPVRLNFYRKDPSSCLEEVRFPDFRIAQALPVNQTTAIEFTPTQPGRYEFTCGMNMFRGVVEVVADDRDTVPPIATATAELTDHQHQPSVAPPAVPVPSSETMEATLTPEGIQTATVTAAKGYQPNRIVVEAGRPVRLDFRRETPSSCYAQLLIPEFAIAVDLPEGKTIPVEFTPTQPGEYEFMCGMKMNFGTIEVRPGADALNIKTHTHATA
ncbi:MULTISPECIES: cupredoxin domain-containing protein [Cyanophyceae]|uniref:cupredoxin domain-containing protein n=1 Tax=Cyanophyceae TaxID=3028117 RepID=UPI001687DBCA|nr:MULTISPECIES: cupredoxin domain-containing protein [Cyanophyceae]MBD1918412.1 cupredoxin domain-containing protein [Phormidium sp. FACHB-77]MBD2028719.1 cupredoxin domain-containing protein [Phormidium sp. FACHB-322]MBD2051140.1 cupredoxin domain-containing protein [Leptolyngbya sp. FACHB-60]